MHALDDAQRAVVAHPPAPLAVTGGFGSGKTTALEARAEALRARGRRPLLLRPTPVRFAVSILERHGMARRVMSPAEQLQLTGELLRSDDPRAWDTLRGELGDPEFASEVAATVLRYRASFLGREELLAHADAAGALERWDELDRFADRYRGELERRGAIDEAEAVVGASLLLRDPAVLATERSRFDDLLVDDYQQADFATARLVAQLAGPAGSVTVAGHAGAALGSEQGRSSRHLAAFPRRFAAEGVDLVGSHRSPAPPALRLVEHGVEPARLAASLVARRPDAVLLRREDVATAVGREWRVVVVADISADAWPAPRPRHRWFDLELLAGPDVPDGDERDRRWLDEERRRFAVAASRATDALVLVSRVPVTPFLADLVA